MSSRSGSPRDAHRPRRLRRATHLVGGFGRALWPGGPSQAREAWVREILTAEEHTCWVRMPGRDRREGVRVARRLRAAVGPGVSELALAAALLHDVGKREARLGVYLRVVATLAGALTGPEWRYAWSDRDGILRRVGLYLRHAEVGHTMLAVAGARDEVATWAAVHHDPSSFGRAGFSADVAQALAEADGEVGAAVGSGS